MKWWFGIPAALAAAFGIIVFAGRAIHDPVSITYSGLLRAVPAGIKMDCNSTIMWVPTRQGWRAI